MPELHFHLQMHDDICLTLKFYCVLPKVFFTLQSFLYITKFLHDNVTNPLMLLS